MGESSHHREADDALLAAYKRWRMGGAIVLEAEIFKIRDKTGEHHLRYFILYEHVLIYRYRKEGRILGVIPVEILRFCGFPKEDQTGCRFHVILRGAVQFSGKGSAKEARHTLHLQAKTPAEATVWVTKLKVLQSRYENSDSGLDRRGRYWLKLGKQASSALDGTLQNASGQDSGSEWEAGEESVTPSSPPQRARTTAPPSTVRSVQDSMEFRVEKQKASLAKSPAAITLIEGYLRKRLRVSTEVKVRLARTRSVVLPTDRGNETKTDKASGEEHTWVKRYFTLTDKELIYGLELGSQIVGIIPIEAISSVAFRSAVAFEFIVAGEPRKHTFELQASDSGQASKWVSALSSLLPNFTNVLIEFDIRGLFWLTIAASRRSTALDAAITYEECEEIAEPEVEPDEDTVVLTQSGRRATKSGTSPFCSYFTQSTQGFVTGMDKPNQDNFANARTFGGLDCALFGVFDGHGPNGHLVSAYLRQRLPELVLSFVDTNITTLQALQAVPQGYATAFLACNQQLDEALTGMLEFSGSTAVLCQLQRIEDQIYLWSCNLGDSRAVLAKQVSGQFFLAVPLSCDHLPTCPGEQKRIEDAGGRVGTNQHGQGSSRVWLRGQDIPGLAVARAFGDGIASRVGVVAEPEVWVRTLVSNDSFIILASDGLWEFISCQEAVDIVAEILQANGERNAEKAAKLLVTAAELRWAEEETESRDDITVTVVFL